MLPASSAQYSFSDAPRAVVDAQDRTADVRHNARTASRLDLMAAPSLLNGVFY